MQKLKYFFFLNTMIFSLCFVTNYLETRTYFKYVLQANAKEFPDEIFKHQRSCKVLKGQNHDLLVLRKSSEIPGNSLESAKKDLGKSFLDLSIETNLFGHVYLNPYNWTHLFGPVYLDQIS